MDFGSVAPGPELAFLVNYVSSTRLEGKCFPYLQTIMSQQKLSCSIHVKCQETDKHSNGKLQIRSTSIGSGLLRNKSLDRMQAYYSILNTVKCLSPRNFLSVHIIRN